MKKTYCYILAVIIAMQLTACGNNTSQNAESSVVSSVEEITETEPQTETETIAETTIVDTMTDEEQEMYKMLIDFSKKMGDPSSLRLTKWFSGEKNDTDFNSIVDTGKIQFAKGDKIQIVEITGGNKLGGTVGGYAYVKRGELVIFDDSSDIYFATSDLLAPSSFDNYTVYEDTSVNKINIALKEYFESIGY